MRTVKVCPRKFSSGQNAHAQTNLRSARKKLRSNVVARNRMTALQGLGLVSPRAGAHVWGKRARILTEINRITQPAFSTPAKIGWNRISDRLSKTRTQAGIPANPFLALLFRQSWGRFRCGRLRPEPTFPSASCPIAGLVHAGALGLGPSPSSAG
jgi:hypothetical protein